MNIKEVARRAGVSISTVSRVINNTTFVSEDVRERVEKIISETGYRPNSLAKELQRNKTNTIGIIMSVEVLELSSIGRTINAISDILKENGYHIMLANSRFNLQEEIENFITFQEKRVDGILYFAANFAKEHYDLLKNYPIPIVIIGQENKYLDFPCVLHDDYYAAKAATEYLIENGHRHIGFIGSPSFDAAVGLTRKNGFETAMNIHGLTLQPNFMASGDFSIKSGYEAMLQIVENSEVPPTAVFATTDYMAMGAMHYLREKGYRVPEDISIIGFDDVDVAAVYNPPLTTIHSDYSAVGQQATRLLLDILHQEDISIKKYVVGYELKERASVKRCN